MRIRWPAGLLLVCLSLGAAEFVSQWPEGVARPWVGESMWANRLQDWRVADGWLECVADGADAFRTVHLLTHRLQKTGAAFSTSVTVRLRAGQGTVRPDAVAGFLVGVGKDEMDYRAAALVQGWPGNGAGVFAGVGPDGKPVIHDFEKPLPGKPAKLPPGSLPRDAWRLIRTDSAEPGQSGKLAFDGKPGTIWHSEWRKKKPRHPHEIIIDMGKEETLRGVAYLPRQGESPGRIGRGEIYVSDKADSFGKPVATASFPDSGRLQTVRFPVPITGRFLRVVALDAHNKRPSTTVAELYALGTVVAQPEQPAAPVVAELRLELSGKLVGEACELTLRTRIGNRETGVVTKTFPAARLVGNVALVSHPGRSLGRAGRHAFRDWRLVGERVVHDPTAELGPVLCTQHTLSRGVLKLTAQFMPLGEGDVSEAVLEMGYGGKSRGKEMRAPIISPGWTATFQVPDWPSLQPVPYRVAYDLRTSPDSVRRCVYKGTIRPDPARKQTIVVAGFTGNHSNSHAIGRRPTDWVNGMWFPHTDIVKHVGAQKPDVLFFSGDQVYEGKNPTRADAKHIKLDYLYKWYLWCWAYRDLTREIVTVTIPDDHDVYQGNLWGGGGRKTDRDTKGGYVRPADFVQMVERTQTSHLPDPWSKEKLPQGITSYYTDMVYGRIGFAILEDRKFKSGPFGRFPGVKMVRPDHVTDSELAVKKLDVPGLELLGQEQLRFLEGFAGDWRGTDMKVALSQTIFANMATHHGGGLRRLRCDMDSNGWPQSGRNRAVAALRKGFVFHLAGDQHLGSLVHHGIDAHNDAIWSLCVPSIANFYPRGWRPEATGANREPGMAEHLGEHRDGFDNPVTVYAVTNPPGLGGAPSGHKPTDLHDKMPGYGILRLDKRTRQIQVECWPRPADPAAGGTQYPGWPRTVSQFDNYPLKGAAALPMITVRGVANPVVRVFRQDTGELVYAVRILGTQIAPRVPDAKAAYTVEIGGPPGRVRRATDLRPGGKPVTLQLTQ
ncbi:MAG: hypothetical protein HN380_06275 [Victivallales bacterium]|nr:hypothetical protein [Victivallales bacterium]